MADQTTTTTSWLQPQWQDYLNNLKGLTANPLEVYGGQTVATPSGLQQNSWDMANQFMTNGSPTLNAANGAIQGLSSGAYNPYQGATNPYAGTNPFVNQVVNQSNQQITDAYGRGVAAQTDSAAARAGSFGGSGYQEQVGANQRNLGDALAANTSGLLKENYYQNMNQANLDANRNLQATMGGAGLGLQSANQDLASIMAGNQLGTQATGYQQQLADAMKNYYQDTQMEPFVRSDIMGNALSRAGGAGSSTTQQLPGQSGWANALAALGLLGSLW